MFLIPAIGVFAGWIIVMPATVLTLALRSYQLLGENSASEYSILLAAGWLTLILSLSVSGRVSDLVARKFDSWKPVILFGIFGTASLGYLLSQANSFTALAITWLAIQLPAAAIVSSALAIAATTTNSVKKGLASGLTGGAPVFALLVGSLLVQMVSGSPERAFLITSTIGAIAAIPLLFAKNSSGPTTTPDVNVSDSDLVASPKLWKKFILAGFLLSCATSSANGYLVAYTKDILKLDDTASAELATMMVLVATVASIIAGIVAGLFAHTKLRALHTYSVAAVTVGVTLAILALFPNSEMAIFAAVIFGAAFGTANGLELSIYLHSNPDGFTSGKKLSTFTNATTAPYVLVPAVAALLLNQSSGQGLVQLWLIGAACAVAASLLILKASLIRQ
jgi:MFS family permease